MTLQTLQIAKRLEEASGYLELGMPRQALNRLETVQDAGHFEAAAHLLRGQAFRAQERFSEAAVSLTTAASMLPTPLQRHVLSQACDCYRRAGIPLPRSVASEAGSGDGNRPPHEKPRPEELN